MMKEMKANEIMKMFENQNVVNRADFTFEEYLEQLTSFQKIVSSCVYEGDDSYRLSDSITKLQQLIRSKGIKDDPFVKKAMDEIKEVSKELAIIMAGKRGEGRIEYALSFVERPDLTVFKNVYITDGEEETEIDTILVTNNGIVFLEIKNAKKDITISQDGRLLYENQISYHNDSIGDKMEKKRRLLKYQIEKEMQRLGVDKFGKPVRIESRIVFSTPYKTRIHVTDLYRKERYCFGNQLKYKIENYYSGTCYESEDLQMLNEIIGSMESNKKRFQQKLDFTRINREFAQLMEMLTKQEVTEPAKIEPILLNRDNSKGSRIKKCFRTFGKIAVTALFATVSIASGVAISKSYK